MTKKRESSRLIRDIRIYSDDHDLESVCISTNDFSKYYSVKFDAKQYANRFVCKLRELGFRILGYNHIFVVFSPNIPPNKKATKKDEYFLWKRETSFGLNPDHWNALSKEEQKSAFIDYLTEIVIYAGAPNQKEIVHEAAKQLRKHGRELLIKIYSKKSKYYDIEVALQIQPYNRMSLAYVTHTNNRTQKKRRGQFLEFKRDNDIYHICGSVVVKNDIIHLNPRKSWVGDRVKANYKGKLEVPVSELPVIN